VYAASDHHALPPFPTRRSSDLQMDRIKTMIPTAPETTLCASSIINSGVILLGSSCPWHNGQERPHPIPESVLVTSAPPNKTKSIDRKSTRLNSSHVKISYAVFC